MITARVLFATAALATVVTVGSGCIKSYQQQSAGLTGCPPDEIKIEDKTVTSWRATCRGRSFWCSMGETASCTPELAAEPGATPPGEPEAVETPAPEPEPATEPGGDPTEPAAEPPA